MMSLVQEETPAATTNGSPATGNGSEAVETEAAAAAAAAASEQKSAPKQLPKLSRAAQSIAQMRTVGAVTKQVDTLQMI